MSNNTDVSREKLASDLRVVISDAEELLRATAGQMGEKAIVARERIHDSCPDSERISGVQGA